MYSIEVDGSRLVALTLSGLLTVDEVDAYHHEFDAVVGPMTGGAGGHLLLVDARECLIQSQEVVAALQDMVARPTVPASRIAVVTPRTLARSQAKRILVREGTETFEDMGKARSWLQS